MRHLIIGMGSIGRRHARVILAHGHEVSGWDPYVKEISECPLHGSMDGAWAWGPDMVWICSPTGLHAGQATAALQKRVHVFIEKPVASNVEDALHIQQAWESAPKRCLVWVACNMRYHPAVPRLKRYLDEGSIGRPLVLRIHFSHSLPQMRPGVDYRRTYAATAGLGGGIILDDIHDIDLALWLGGPVRKTVASAARSGTLEMDAEDVAHITMLHENGLFSEIHMDFLRKDKSRGIEVIGENGTLEWRSLGKNPERASLRRIRAGEQTPEELWHAELTSPDEMFQKQFSEMLDALSDPPTYGVRLQGGIEALRIAEEARAGFDRSR